jgi:hypothetical protein
VTALHALAKRKALPAAIVASALERYRIHADDTPPWTR